jgi:hypothetical protein
MKAAELNINHRHGIGFIFSFQLIGYFVQIFSLGGAVSYQTWNMVHAFVLLGAGIAG